MVNLPDSARLALWFTAVCQGAAGFDDLLDAVVGGDAAHDVVPATGGDSEPLGLALGRLRTSGAHSASLALPVPGDPLGVAGPADFNDAAMTVGEAVLFHGAEAALVPWRSGAGVVWRLHDAHSTAQVPDLFEAGTALRTIVGGAAEALAALDVARWRPELADELMALRRDVDLDLPSQLSSRAVSLIGLAARCTTIVELALNDDAGVSAYEIDRRRETLSQLGAAARRAMVAACAASGR